MSGPVRTHRGQRKPWASIPRIDWDHPLTKGLIGYWYDAGSGPIDLVTGAQRTLNNVSNPPLAGPRASKYGSGLLAARGASIATGMLSFPELPIWQTFFNAAPYSFAVGFMLPTAPSSGDSSILFTICDATTETPIKFGVASASATDFLYSYGNNTQIVTASGFTKVGQFQTTVGVAKTAGGSQTYIDGVPALTSAAIATSTWPPSGSKPRFHGFGSYASQVIGASTVYFGAIWNKRELSAAEARLIHHDPYCFLIYPEDEMFGAVVGVDAAISGTLAVEETADVAVFAGQAVISAALAVAEAPDTASFAGQAVISAALAVTEAKDVAAFAGGPVIAATLAVTDLKDVAAFAGSLSSADITATFAVTEAPDVAAFAGGPVILATLAVTEAKDVAAFAGGPIITAVLVTTEAKDVASFSGSVVVAGTFALIEAADIVSLGGNVTSAITGTLTAIDTRDIVSISGNTTVAISGTLAAKEAGIGLSNNIFLENAAVNTVVGTLAVTGIDTAVISGSVTGIAGTLSVNEAQDQALFFGGLVGVTGTLVANEVGILLSSNTFLENAVTNTVIGALSVIGVEGAAFSGFVGVSGTLATTEIADAAVLNGTLVPITTGMLAATETPDVAAFSVAVFTAITGQLAATEAIDGAVFNGAVHSPPVGQFAVTETQDAAVFSGAVTGIPGQLAVTEAADLAAFIGITGVLGQFAAIEAPDLAVFNGAITEDLTTGDLLVVEPADVAFFTGVAAEPDDSDFENWKFGHRFDRSLTSRFPWQSSFGSRL